MARAPFQVLVIPYLMYRGGARYAAFRRRDAGWWQWIAGGGEQGETPLAAAQREAHEEAGIGSEQRFTRLESTTTIPVIQVVGHFAWGEETLVIPEHTFAVELPQPELTLSREHTEYAWLDYDTALKKLKWDSNRSALWELHYRLQQGALK